MKKNYLLILTFGVIGTIAFAQEKTDTTKVVKEAFKPSGKVLMEVFGDLYNKVGGDVDSVLSGPGEYQKTPKEYNAFAFRRIYLGYEYNFTEKFYANVTLESGDGIRLADNRRAPIVKFAYFEWRELFPGSKLIVGSQKTTIWEAPERIWGYRSVEKTIADFRRIGASSDVGIALQGRIDKGSIFGYHVMVANGNNLVPESNKYKKYYGTLNANLINKKLVIELHGNYEKTSDSSHYTVTKAFIGFDLKSLSVGLEQLMMLVNDGNETTTAMGSSVFIRGSIIENKLSAFARFDFFDENIDEDLDGNIELFTVFGIDYRPIKQISIMPNLWINTYDAKDPDATNRKPDIVARLTFRFKI